MPNADCQLKKAKPPLFNRQRHARIWITLIIVLTAISVIFLVCLKYLPRAADAWNHADMHGRKLLALMAVLLVGVLLFFLLVMLGLAVRYSRPRKPTGKTVTRYIDAWAESAKRMKTPPKEDNEQS